MVCQRECFNCQDTDDVCWSDSAQEFYCDVCIDEGVEGK